MRGVVEDIYIKPEIYAHFLDDCIVKYVQQLTNYNINDNPKHKVIFNNCEMRYGFVIDVNESSAKILQIGSNKLNDYSVEIFINNRKCYVWCDKISESPFEFDFPKIVYPTK